MSLKNHIVTNYESFNNLIEDLDKKGEPVFLLISGSKGKDGKSWCPDCEQAEPVVERYISSKLNKDVHIVRIELERTYFKDPKNPFRLCHKVRLTRVPTMMYWKGIKRLEESECKNVDLLDMFFEGFTS